MFKKIEIPKEVFFYALAAAVCLSEYIFETDGNVLYLFVGIVFIVIIVICVIRSIYFYWR